MTIISRCAPALWRSCLFPSQKFCNRSLLIRPTFRNYSINIINLLDRETATGVLTEQKDRYLSGQLFLHSLKGYRGVVIFRCELDFYDMDSKATASTDADAHEAPQQIFQLPEPTRKLFYCALVDERDLLEKQKHKHNSMDVNNTPLKVALYEYVPHECVQPYNPGKGYVFQNQECEDFFGLLPMKGDVPQEYKRPDGTKTLGIPKRKVSEWMTSSQGVLTHSSVSRATTDDVEVVVMPFFLKKKDDEEEYMWFTRITISNFGEQPIQVVGREITQTDKDGNHKATVTNVGGFITPYLESKEYFTLWSMQKLEEPSGGCFGQYFLNRKQPDTPDHEDSPMFFAVIPPVKLVSPFADNETKTS
eukprot:m.66447 g.66447  ORF g.66447 m.66447 type:complete len:362 (+) comp11807_c0_seq1:96-1181(+)